ncbi:hypothetical protein [Actinocrispum wychmicini]|uniref:Uncharacterized protein n=1 Tax=Actinocrispum wychmicini TaxID=1213861 RepID=A0A4V2S921_9PSEU|nr:hypothetical protein [Actinocrispum wychmicini]TCO65900.1 hypothetical protein EV192_1011692 [Actinocrispum wychmicini]
MTLLLLLLVLGLVIYGLERNHHRMPKPRARLHGNVDAFWPH